MDGLGSVISVIAVPVLYFLPSIIVATKVHPEKTLIFALNLLLGWTVICWFIALYMSLSQKGAEEIETRQAVAAMALKGQYESEIKELRRKNRELYSAQRPQRMADTSPPDTDLSKREADLSRREAELDSLKSEYEERLRALAEERRQAASQPEPEVIAAPQPEVQPSPAPQGPPVPAEYEGEPLYVVVPSQFERVVAETLSRRFSDHEVEAADDAGSRGIDLKLFESGGSQSQPSAIVQCKLQAHDQAVDYGDVSDLRGAMSLAGARQAYLVTTGDFSDDARRMIDSGHLEDQVFLVDGMTFNQWRTQAGLAPVHYLSLAG
ncbi:MAG: restriction endonuclease [Chloroflexi bacterium]|nr:restriction endonuclease [Chloroflexota bacterium]